MDGWRGWIDEGSGVRCLWGGVRPQWDWVLHELSLVCGNSVGWVGLTCVFSLCVNMCGGLLWVVNVY